MDKKKPLSCHPEEAVLATEGSRIQLGRDASGQKTPLSMT